MWGGGSDGGIFLTCKKNPVCQTRFKDYSWDRCQKKALLFGKITVTSEGQIMNAEPQTGVCEEPQPAQACPPGSEQTQSVTAVGYRAGHLHW